jgi:hypothetical protein
MTESEPQNRRLGYGRVSIYGLTLDAQIAKLRGQTDMRRGADRLSWFLTCRHNVLHDPQAVGAEENMARVAAEVDIAIIGAEAAGIAAARRIVYLAKTLRFG